MCFHFQNVLSFSKFVFIFKIWFHSRNVLSFSKCVFIFKMCFHFQNVLSFSTCAFIFKIWFHFQNMISFLECAFIFKKFERGLALRACCISCKEWRFCNPKNFWEKPISIHSAFSVHNGFTRKCILIHGRSPWQPSKVFLQKYLKRF
jgi:hypothetical protein